MNARELARLNRLNRRVVAIEDYIVPDQPLNAVTAHLGDIPSRVVRLEQVLPVTPRSDAELARENRYAARTTLLEEALRMQVGAGVFVDAIGNQRPAVVASESGITRDVPGPLADGSVGVALDGLTNGPARFTPIILPALAPFSIEFWFRPRAFDTDGYSMLVSPGPDGIDDNFGTGVYLTNDAAVIGHAAYRLVLYAFDSINNTQTFNVTDLVLGMLYHVVVTFNGTDAVWFLNGVSDGGVAGIDQVLYGSDGVEYLGIAALFSPWDSYPEPGAASLFDEVAVYPAALTAEQIAAHYALRNAPDAGYRKAVVADGATAYWRFESPNF